MQVELNIGLNRADGGFALANYRKALTTLRTAVPLDCERTFQTNYHKQDGEEFEEVSLFVAFSWTASAEELVTFIGLLSIDLGQDFIAVYCVDKGRGVLVGPKADEWGEFNKEFFRRFDYKGNPI